MNKPITLCDRCDIAASCLLNYDGVPCRKNRTVEPTNADRIRAMTDEELAEFINDTEYGFIDRPGMCDVCAQHRIQNCYQCWLDWLRQEEK